MQVLSCISHNVSGNQKVCGSVNYYDNEYPQFYLAPNIRACMILLSMCMSASSVKYNIEFILIKFASTSSLSQCQALIL